MNSTDPYSQDSGQSGATLAQRIDALLPQTQCTRCGYPDCHSYAQAIAAGAAEINQCPPGGAQGIARLAELLDRPLRPLAASHGVEGPRRVVFIDEATCIGCTLCIQACPVDAIIGAPKQMHAVLEADCTGCELCLPVCPVDCLLMEDASGAATGWDAWSPRQAEEARRRYVRRQARLAQETTDPVVAPTEVARPAEAKRDAIQAALARARQRARMRVDE